MYRIKQLIVVAGPSCAGKTSLLTSIRQGRCDSLCAKLGISAPSSCLQMQAVEIEDLNEGTLDTVLVHFDFYTLDVPEGGYRVLSKLLDNADRVTILTLCARSESLVERNNKRLRKAIGELLTSLLCNPKMLGRKIHLVRWLLKRHRIYKDPSVVASLYQKWADSIGSCDATHYWLDSDQVNILAARPYETAQVGLFSNVRDLAQGKQQDRIAVPSACRPAQKLTGPSGLVYKSHTYGSRHKEAL